ncbi:MAG: cellulase family glycosylhydrolase [Chloroflexi bacterium]|nr:cellulase family glycosylhydrolase [Chloroflexota bacterium]
MRGLSAAVLCLALAAAWLLPSASPAWARAQLAAPDGRLARPATGDTLATSTVRARPVQQVGGPFHYGIQAHLFWTDRPRVVSMAREAGFTWVKQQVRWDSIEPQAKGVYDWRELDAAVAAANQGGLRVLLSISAAPQWATGGNPIAGPPNNYQDFADFMRVVAQRYKGRVHAYEMWNEQNLWYEWGGKGRLNAGDYVRLLRLAYGAVKAVDPGAVVIAGALTPTGVNDGDTAIDDLLYLEQMYAAGVRDVSDAIGAHPHGYNNSPDDWMDTKTVASEGFKGHPSFYFRRLEQYRLLMERVGDPDRPIWITEVGWTTANQAPGYEYGRDNSEQDQARHLVRALEKARDEYPWVQAMFIWSLNFSTLVPPHDEKFPWSIINADWSPRPAYTAIKNMPKGGRNLRPPRPPTAAQVAQFARVGDCRWQIAVQLVGFTRSADVTNSSSGFYDACGVEAGEYASPDAPVGRTNENGELTVVLDHPDFGRYDYVFTDSVGRAAAVTIAYDPSTPPSGAATAANVAEIARVGDCQWRITVQLAGFTPQADVVASSSGSYDACGVEAGAYATPPGGVGRTNENGELTVVLDHPDFGRYDYVFTDSAGRSAAATIAYAP